MDAPNPDGMATDDEFKRFVDEYRVRCLWFLRPDYYPTTREERLRVLDQIERHGDVAAFRRVARMRRWLSPDPSAPSARLHVRAELWEMDESG